MSELFYRAVRLVGGGAFRVASAPLVLHRERAARPGAFLLAANHHSAFDAPLLITVTPRVLYWLSIVELFRHPLSRWFLSAMGASPLDRGKVDSATVRQLVRHLRAGRAVGMFPEGQLRAGAESILEGGSIDEGVAKLAQLADVPVLPCVVLGSEKFARWQSWLPLARTRFAVAYGEAILPRNDLPKAAARTALAQELAAAFRALREELRAATPD